MQVRGGDGVIQVQCTKCDRISEAPHANFTFIMCQVCTTNGDIGFMKVVEVTA